MAGRPRMLMCYLCGREYGSSSLPIHIPQCQKKWEAAEKQKPAKERRALPQPPKEILDKAVGGKTMSNAEVDAFNSQMYKEFDEKTMVPCPFCGRTFSDTAFKHHQRACTAASPAKPAGTGLCRASLTTKMATMDPKVAGSEHGLAGGGSPNPSGRTSLGGRGGPAAQSMDPKMLKKAIKEDPTPPKRSAASTPPKVGPQPAPSSSSSSPSISQEDLVRLAQAVGAWELKQELMLNSPSVALEILNAGAGMNDAMKQISANLNMKPDAVARAFKDESYKNWKVV
eukprot:CAMPEP_0196572788 /NCGR_PEP_ID=MMETSP1081-20130531/2772_1 /TAXON_ID=36882 /ORGANISM="Pyramimonas amylifera, Strain CCMP720" /LENGTH=283 /DNA_ID=CAMNT_0041890223 /DNA_START=102 /DNA_END=953 /DNA_ORIENTATION=+